MRFVNMIMMSLVLLMGSTGDAFAIDFGPFNKDRTEWELDDSPFAETANLFLRVMLDGKPVADADVGIFSVEDDVCRGGNWTNVNGYVSLVVFGNKNNEELYFKVRVGDHVYQAPETYSFIIDDIRASVRQPGILNLNDMKNTLQLAPMVVPASADKQTVDIMLRLNSPQNVCSRLEYKTALPETWTMNTPSKAGIASEAASIKVTNQGKQSDGTYKVVLKSTDLKDPTSFAGVQGDILRVPVVIPAGAQPGVYKVKLQEVQVSNFCGLTYKPVDYEATIVVGDASVLPAGMFAIYGNMTLGTAQADFNALLDERADIAGLDLTNITDIDPDAVVSSANDNLLVYLREGLTVGNESNVIVNGNCRRLVVKDNVPFSVPVAFHADEAYYERHDLKADGMYSICLPFTSEVPEDSKAYSFDHADVDDSKVYFNDVESMEADKPYIISAAGEALTLTAKDVDVAVSPEFLGDYSGFWATYQKVEAGLLTGSYALRNDGSGFGVCDETAYMNPFRAVIRVEGAKAKFLSLVLDGEEDETAVAGVQEKATAADAPLYTVSGIRVGNGCKKGIYIINGGKYIR